jgi:amino acid transporter
MLYGAALMLEFVTLVALRIREPKLRRGFRVPGGMAGAISCGIFPLGLLLLSMVESEHETILGINALVFGVAIIFAGFGVYIATRKARARYQAQATPEPLPAD